MYSKLDLEAKDLLCCPQCKSKLSKAEDDFVCLQCASLYPLQNIKDEKIFDFRIRRPSYCMTKSFLDWDRVQSSWEKCYFERYSKQDDYQGYLKEINFLTPIYTKEFDIKGKVLDVGGGEGMLRHFLPEDKGDNLYINIDPTINVFSNFHARPNALKAFPSLKKQCNFLACHAENLPFQANAFDWAHIRSSLDHFQDPYLAIKEIYRVLKPGGSLLANVTVYGGKSSAQAKENFISRSIYKIKIDGFGEFFKTALRKLFKTKGWETIHTFEWSYENLIDLLKNNNFKIVKEHWQEPPFTMVLWVQAKKE